MEQEEAWGIPLVEEGNVDQVNNVNWVDEIEENDEGQVDNGNAGNEEVVEATDAELLQEDNVDEVNEHEENDEGQVDEGDAGNEEIVEAADGEEEVAAYVDEGIVEDCSNEPDQILVRSHEVPNSDVVNKNQQYCYTYCMVLVSIDPEKDYKFCHRCYMELVRLSGVEEYEHRHYDCHTTSKYEECSFYCSSCRLPLEQVRLTQTCVICNYVKTKKDKN